MESQSRQDLRVGCVQYLRAAIVACCLFMCASWDSAFAFQNGDDVRQRELLKLISDAEQSMAGQQWLQAVEQFDAAWAMASEREDPLLTASGADVNQLGPGDTQQLAGGRARLEDLFLHAPDDFTSEFRAQFEKVAESRILEAVNAGDFPTLRRLTLRYAFCPSAQNGLRILTRQSIDRGDDLEAGLLLNRIIRIAGGHQSREDSAALLLQIAVCNWRAGLTTDAVEGLRALMAIDPQPIVLQDLSAPASITRTDLQNWFAVVTGTFAAKESEWTQPGGDYRRCATGSRGPARLEQTWFSDSLTIHDVLYADRLNPVLHSLRTPMLEFDELRKQQHSIVIPAATPLRVGELVVFRTPWGVRAVSAVDGAIVWEVARPDGRMLDALQTMEENFIEAPSIGDPNSEDTTEQASMQQTAAMRTAMLPLMLATGLRNELVRANTSAQLAASATTVYVCEDASGTMDDDQYRMLRRTQGGKPASNFIRAYDLTTGLFKWEVGGQTQAIAQPKGKGNLLAGYYFLGAPLILGNRIYVLAESGEGIYLLQIAEPAATDSGPANPRIVRSQLLTQPQFSSGDHPTRRNAGLVPSYAHGLLICPTCDERIVAVSADDNAVRWVFRYAGVIRLQEIGGDAPVLSGSQDPRDSDRVDLESRWTDSLPRIAGNRIFLTPRDSDKLFCLDLQSGKEHWNMDRGQFHTIAAILDDRIILCGNSEIQAFRVENCEPLWSHSIVDGIVCGRPATDGQLLHVPTSEPAIVSLDSKTGLKLASRYLVNSSQERTEGNELRTPGNLLISETQVLSQDLESLRAYSQVVEELTPIDLATEQLLRNDQSGAIALLESGMDNPSNRAAARSQLIDVLMEKLRSNFATNRPLVERIRELIKQAEVERHLPSLLHLMLGMSLPDSALLSERLHSRTQRQRSELTRLIAQGLSAGETISVKELADVLPELIAGQNEAMAIGSLQCLKSLTIAAEIRKALKPRTLQERIAIQNELREVGVAAMALTPDRNSQLQFVRDLSASGLPQLALHVLQSDPAAVDEAAGKLMTQQIQLEIMRSGTDDGTSAKSLLDNLLAKGDLSLIRSLHAEFQYPDVASPLNNQRLITVEAMINRSVFQDWFSAHADAIASEASGWGSHVQIEQSDHRTVMPPQKLPHDIPDEAIPLHGSPGQFRGWSFVVLMKEQKVAAFDAEGRVCWTFPISDDGDDLNDRRPSDAYFTASGHLLLLNFHGSFYSLDTSQLRERADGDERVLEPQLLWMRRLNDLSNDLNADQRRRYGGPADLLPQFAPQLSAYHPVAPLTPAAVALVAGRRLLVYDTLTGRLNWQLDEVPSDAVLSTTHEAVLVLSEDVRQIESRSLLDGAKIQVSGIPEWWDEANGNVSSSVSDFEIEPGESRLWRVCIHGQSCVLFRMKSTGSSLECRDLMTDAVAWSVDLPAHSVFSNVANDVVAILSDQHELRLVRIDTGHIMTNLDVTPVPEPRDLYLVQSLGNYIVLPEGVDDPSIDLDPVIDAMHLYGRIYCVDANTMKLRWDEAIDHRYIRQATAQRQVILPNAPILVLLKRGGPADPKTGIRRVRIGAKLIDVRTGKEIFNQDDVGFGLNDFWLRIDQPKHLLELSFESHVLTLTFSDKQTDEKPGQRGE